MDYSDNTMELVRGYEKTVNEFFLSVKVNIVLETELLHFNRKKQNFNSTSHEALLANLSWNWGGCLYQMGS